MKLINPSIEILSNAYVSPLTKLVQAQGGSGGSFDGGVYYSDGSVCSAGLQLKSGYTNIPRAFPGAEEYDSLSGAHVFGGMLQNEHFGHFMIESLARLWALNHLSARYDSVVFYSRLPGHLAPKFAMDIIRLLGFEIELRLVTQLTRIETLAVPSSIVGADNGVMYGHSVVRELFGPLRVPSDCSRKVYVSRSELGPRDGGLLLEKVIEQSLAAEGYEIVHPQSMPISEQLKIYSSADQLIFADGSAIHLYALVARQSQRIFVIWRRKENYLFDWQLASFGGPRVEGQPCLSRLYGTVADAQRQMVSAKGLLDFADLGQQLSARGFITGRHWIVPTEAEVDHEVAYIRSLMREPLIDYGPNY